jgi:predicted component of type VI protein secretion system
LIGRDGQCDLVVDDRRVSRRHARISWGEGRFCVEDLGSTNGTHFNNSVERMVGSKEFTTVDKIDLVGVSLDLTCVLVLRDLEAERADTQPVKIHQP